MFVEMLCWKRCHAPGLMHPFSGDFAPKRVLCIPWVQSRDDTFGPCIGVVYILMELYHEDGCIDAWLLWALHAGVPGMGNGSLGLLPNFRTLGAATVARARDGNCMAATYVSEGYLQKHL